MRRWVVAAFLAAGCGGDGGVETQAILPGTEGGSAAYFTVSPIDPSNIDSIVPLGNLNPPGHTFPTDHVYFMKKNPQGGYPVYAPSAGTVISMFTTQQNDYKIVVRVTAKITYYLDHVWPDAGIVTGKVLQAGQKIGVTGGSAALDLGLSNEDVTLTGFIQPARYPDQTLHADSPFKYFSQPLRSTLYDKVDREGPDKDGKIDLDLPGRLVGGWFLQGLPVGEQSFDYASWDKHLAFVYDVKKPAAVRIAIGGTLSMSGLYAVQSGAPDPAGVSSGSGKTGYRLFDPWSPGSQMGLLVGEMTGPNALKVETFAGSQAGIAEFTSAAKTYTR